jgi:DNA replication protein DnaC
MSRRRWLPVQLADCDDCDGSRYLDEAAAYCRCLRPHAVLVNGWRAAGMPLPAVRSAVAPFLACEAHAAADAARREWLRGASAIVLGGPPSTGKTKLAAMIVNSWTRQLTGAASGYRTLRAGELLWIEGALLRTPRYVSADLIHRIQRAGLVVLDDVQIGRDSREVAPWHQAAAEDAILARFGRPLIVTLNHDADQELDDLPISAPVLSRMRVYSYTLAGPEWRR